jgi:hypothetical protein
METEGTSNPVVRRPLMAVFTSHWLAMFGLGLVLTAIVAWLCLLPAQLRYGEDNPYIGLATVAVGGVLVLGAVLAPFGLLLGPPPPSRARSPPRWTRGRRGCASSRSSA